MNIENSKMYVKTLMETTLLTEIMKKAPMKINQNVDLSEASKLFLENMISHLLVVDSEGCLVGLLTQKYLYKAHSPRKIVSEEPAYDPNIIVDGDTFYNKDILDSFILKKIMFKDPYSLGERESVSTAILNMRKRNISCIPIIDEGRKVVGNVTHFEIVNYITNLILE